MGWFWSGKAAPAAAADTPPHAPASPAAPAPAAASTAASTAAAPPKDDGLDADERELQKFLALLQADAPAGADSARPAPKKVLSFWSKAGPESGDASPDGKHPVRERSLAEALLPTRMSCQQAFDMAWGCQSPVGQWRAIYRAGEVKTCSALWEDFWFCMRVKGYGPGAARDDAVRSHYRERELARYYGPGQPSSEDVWRSRTVDELLPPTAVFHQPFQHVLGGGGGADSSSAADAPVPATERDDADKIRADLERRRQIREQMGYEK